MNICINCNKLTKNPKFCCRACSASYNTKGRKHSSTTKYKISKTLGGNGFTYKCCKRCQIIMDKSTIGDYCAVCVYHFKYKCNKCGKFFTSIALKTHDRFCGKTTIGIDRQGYEYFMHNGKFKYVHRYLIEINIGRKLKTNEIVHHIDGDKQNNSIENLEVMTVAEHTSLHHKIKAPRSGIKEVSKISCAEFDS